MRAAERRVSSISRRDEASEFVLRPESATLFMVATPLGNLGDLTERARACLAAVPVVACEDTRVTRRLLAHIGVSPRVFSVREANEEAGAEAVLGHLRAGKSVAYCTDAGTPGVSDPGAVLVARVRAAGFRVAPVAGPSAVATALSVAGFPSSRYHFAGFLPSRPRDRRLALAELAPYTCPVVIYESPHRMNAFLSDAHAELGEREVVIGRELTKRHEEVVFGRLGAIPEREWRGELTIVLAGCAAAEVAPGRGSKAAQSGGQGAEDLSAWIIRRLAETPGIRARELAREAARAFAIRGGDAYRAVLAARGRGDRPGEGDPRP